MEHQWREELPSARTFQRSFQFQYQLFNTLVGSLQGLPFRACRRVIETCENIRNKDIFVGIDVPFLGVIERLGCQISAAPL